MAESGGAVPGDPVVATVWDWRRAGEAPEAAADRERSARRRGLVQAAVGLAVASLLALWKPVLAIVAATIALLVGVTALVSPARGFARIEAAVARVAYAIGLAMTWILMPLLFFLLFLPVGLLLRARGRLGITRGPDRSEPTYWNRPRATRTASAEAAAKAAAQGSDGAPEAGPAAEPRAAVLARYGRQF